MNFQIIYSAQVMWRNLKRPIDDQGSDATWRIVRRLITREIRAVDLHLSEGGYVARSDSSDRFLISTVDQEEL